MPPFRVCQPSVPHEAKGRRLCGPRTPSADPARCSLPPSNSTRPQVPRSKGIGGDSTPAWCFDWRPRHHSWQTGDADIVRLLRYEDSRGPSHHVDGHASCQPSSYLRATSLRLPTRAQSGHANGTSHYILSDWQGRTPAHAPRGLGGGPLASGAHAANLPAGRLMPPHDPMKGCVAAGLFEAGGAVTSWT